LDDVASSNAKKLTALLSICQANPQKSCMSGAALYVASMELAYPINLVGFGEGLKQGDVLTRDGEYLGVWTFIEDEDNETGVFDFVADGESEPMFTETVPVLSSGMRTGMAMSDLCRSIRDWHEA
jgi:hypothetical protein